jgi:diguanylate cyclase (GGDEF)-like protein
LIDLTPVDFIRWNHRRAFPRHAMHLANDQYGHEAGDQLLMHFVAVLRQGLREYDRIFRMGGDEFVLIMPTADPTDAIHRIRTLLRESPALTWQQHTH